MQCYPRAFYKLLPFAKFLCIFLLSLLSSTSFLKKQFNHLRAVARLQNKARQVSSAEGASRLGGMGACPLRIF